MNEQLVSTKYTIKDKSPGNRAGQDNIEKWYLRKMICCSNLWRQGDHSTKTSCPTSGAYSKN